MARGYRLQDPREGRWIRRVPIVSLVTFSALSLIFAGAYETTAASSQACFTPGIGLACREASPLWVLLAAVWGVSAIGVALLMGAQSALARKDRTLGTPSSVLLGLGAIVTVLGLLWLATSPWVGYGNPSGSSEVALDVAYITSALLLLAATFVDFDPDLLPGRSGPAGLAVGNAGLALTAGLMWLH